MSVQTVVDFDNLLGGIELQVETGKAIATGIIKEHGGFHECPVLISVARYYVYSGVATKPFTI